jgi:broad specificity phosphatase PhoE
VSDRVDLSYQSLYHPSYPENGTVFMERCYKVIKLIVAEMEKTKQQEVALITHASTLVALTRALAKKGKVNFTK